VALPHTIPARASAASDLGVMPANSQLTSVTLTFNMTDAQQAALTQLLIDLQNPSSPRYHQWLTPEQFGAQFGLSTQDMATVSTWLKSQGFTVTETARGSNFITFSGTAGQIQKTFGTSIHSLAIDGETRYSNLTDPVLPAALASIVTNITGLNDFKPKSRARTRVVKLDAADTTGLHPQFTSSISGNHYVAPGDFYTIYNEAPLLTTACGANLCTGIGVGAGTGGGYSIAVMGRTDINLTDVTAFRTAAGLCTTVSATCPNPLPTVVLNGPDPGTITGDLAEASLDVEWAGATAPNAKIVYVNTGENAGGVFASLLYAINHNLAPIITISYGDCEQNVAAANLSAYNQYFQQANAQGQTIVGPAGDSGATDCDYYNYPAVGGLAVDYPASSPFVTSAGGSSFNDGTGTGATSYWSSTNNSYGGSAVGYIPETIWNESSATNGLAAAGGGASAFFTKPYWQVGLTPADFSRDVPDIALNSASNHDGTLYCVSGSCVNGTFRASDGQTLSVVGGTSVAAPSFAGVLALIEQSTGSRIGNAGPMLYALGNSTYRTNVYNDTISGNNLSPCITGTPNCPTGASIGYSAGPGYDQVSGWGSVNVYNLATKWSVVPPISAGTTIGQTLSKTTLTTSSPACGTSSNTLALSISVATAGSPPTGTVQLLVDNVATGSPIALSGGTATTSFSTASLSSGGHTITAVYSGDTVNASSKGYIPTDVVSGTAPDFLFTPCTASASAVSGGSAPGIVFTVAPVNGFTGTVTFTATTTDSVTAGFVFTPATVTINSTGSATTSLVLQAFVAKAVTATGQHKLHAANQESPKAPWYTAGSGMALASVLLLVMPRRRRWGALLAVVLSVGALSAVGCGSSSSSTTTTTTPTTTNAAPGTYNLLVTASATTSTGVVNHSSTLTFTVR
jgi:subtilase family serine protease